MLESDYVSESLEASAYTSTLNFQGGECSQVTVFRYSKGPWNIDLMMLI